MGRDLSFIFEKKPMRWGLRGDPYLWDEMQESCIGKSLDIDEYEIGKFVCDYFKKVTGKELTYNEEVYVERLAHGGMSSGFVSGAFWITKGIPLLIENLRKIKVGYPVITLCGSTRFKEEFIEVQKRLTLEKISLFQLVFLGIPVIRKYGTKWTKEHCQRQKKCWMICINVR